MSSAARVYSTSINSVQLPTEKSDTNKFCSLTTATRKVPRDSHRWRNGNRLPTCFHWNWLWRVFFWFGFIRLVFFSRTHEQQAHHVHGTQRANKNRLTQCMMLWCYRVTVVVVASSFTSTAKRKKEKEMQIFSTHFRVCGSLQRELFVDGETWPAAISLSLSLRFGGFSRIPPVQCVYRKHILLCRYFVDETLSWPSAFSMIIRWVLRKPQSHDISAFADRMHSSELAASSNIHDI